MSWWNHSSYPFHRLGKQLALMDQSSKVAADLAEATLPKAL